MASRSVTSAMTVRPARAAGPAKGDWVASTCQGCTQWCAIQIFVQEGRAVRVRGNPLSKTNHGYVCPRGHLIPQQVYDPDRIKVPMKRTNANKGRDEDPGFVPIAWDEAFALIAARLGFPLARTRIADITLERERGVDRGGYQLSRYGRALVDAWKSGCSPGGEGSEQENSAA